MVVLDTSALIEMAMRSEAGLALQSMMETGERVASVDLLRAEAVSVFRKIALKGQLSKAEALALMEECLGFVDDFYPLENLQTEVLAESIRLQHSSYDMFYFVLARRLGATLFTTDKRLMNLCLNNGVDCLVEMDLTR